jgi:hypothetical protein
MVDEIPYLAPRDLIEDFMAEPVGGLVPLWWIAEVIPQTKNVFFS